MKNLSILKSSCLLLLVLTIFSSCEKLTLEQADEYIASKLTKNGIRIGLIGEYLFNGNTFDDSGYGNHGTISGNVATSIDRFDKAQSAYLFAPGVNNKITIPNTAHFSLVNSLSISLWVKFNSNWNYHSESLIFKGSYPMNNGWEVNVNQDDSYFGTGNYSFQSAISKGNGPLSPNYKQSFAEINKWRQNNMAALQKAAAAVNAGADATTEFGPLVSKFNQDMETAHGPFSQFAKTAQTMAPKLSKYLVEAQQKAKELNLNGDLIILRHVLEHVKNPIDFISYISNCNQNKGLIYIEVPDFNWIIRNQTYFDIFYEHVNYFRPTDFESIFNKIIKKGNFFNDQYQYIIADLANFTKPKKIIKSKEPIVISLDKLDNLVYELINYKDKNIYSLDEMIDMYDNDKLNYSFVSKRICCPCCELKINEIKIDDETASIKSKRSEHEPNCDYYGLKISQNDIKKMIATCQHTLQQQWPDCGISYGIAHSLESANESECLALADQRMYQYKRAKHNPR